MREKTNEDIKKHNGTNQMGMPDTMKKNTS